MKKSIVILLAGAFLLLSSCATNSDIDNLQSQIDGLKSGQIATIENQINSINGSITSLQEADREIKGYITALQNTASELQKSINSADGKIDDLEKALTLVNSAIENLKAKDSALEQRITDLKDYVDTQLRGAKDWVSATFATLEQYNGIVSEIGGLRGSINSINTAIEQMESRLNGKITLMKGEIEEAYTKAIGSLESSLKNWVNEQLEGYWTIAEAEGKLETLEGNLTQEDESIRGDIGKLRASLDSARTELTEGYKAAIKSAIETNNGVLDGKLSETVSGLNTRIDGEVSTINERIGKLEKRVLNLEAAVSELLSRIQSLAYIPRYTDGASTMWLKIKSDGNIETRDTLEFRVSPADCADELVKVWESAVSAEAVSLMTRGTQETVTLPVVSVSGGNGKISVVLDGSSLSEEFYAGEQQMSVVVIISDGNNELTSDYISIIADKDLDIPNNIILYTSTDGKIVEPYNTEAFGATIVSNRYESGRGIIVFDGDVTSIGDLAFYKCTGLTSIGIPSSVTNIGKAAFGTCTSLSSIHIPESVTSIGDGICATCTELSIITVDAANIYFDSRDNCNAIIEKNTGKILSGCKNTIIPDSVTSIGNEAFRGCIGLASIDIPSSVTSIGAYSFYGCIGIKTIEIPSSVTSIGESAFHICTGLTSIDIPSSVTSIGESAFFKCTGLTSINIPSSVKSIGERAFAQCTGLTSIDIPASVTSIEGYTFNSCSRLTSVVIPSSVTSIGAYSFYGCTGIKTIQIPDSVTSIEKGAFCKCTGLTSIDIPASVTSIGERAFKNCSRLISISSLATKTYLIHNNTFEDTNNCPIYVPTESVEAYKEAEGWISYADRIQAIPNDYYTSYVTWTLGTYAYDDGVATVNGVTDVKVLKLGTSTKVGMATIVVPKGTKSVSFYGVSWKGNPATVVVKTGDSVIYSQDLAANDGASGNSPYTINVTDSDHYIMTLPSQHTEDTNVTITTAEGSKTRIVLFGIKAH